VTDDLRTRLEERLSALRDELAAGRRVLAELEAREREVHETCVRIAGAIQVLEEELDHA
jgi:hypothetical protein